MKRIDLVINETLSKNQSTLPGTAVFELYDTYGFPADLSRIIAEEKNLTVDEKGFEEEMAKQKQRSKKSSAQKVYDWVILEERTESFVGYDQTETETYITRYRKVENKDGEFYQIVLSKSPFYPEGGGQIGDKGILIPSYAEGFDISSPGDISSLSSGESWGQDSEIIEVLETRKENNLIVSLIKDLPKDAGAVFYAKVQQTDRKNTQANHSVTHLLHEALREVLGTHVEQKGSFVGPDYLRFDFSHFAKMSDEDLKLVEDKVNSKIKENIALEEFREIPITEAMEKGAMALFGEKYGDKVRMIQFGSSKELCGGTHVKATGEIGHFKIRSENSTAAGIRRIEAISGDKSTEYYANLETQLKEISSLLKSKDIAKSVQKLLEENSALKSEMEGLKKAQAKNETANWKNDFVESADKKLLVKKVSLDTATVKDVVFQLKKEIPNALIIIISDADSKPMITVGVSADLEATYHAGNIVKELAKEIQGGGGGNSGFATAGGKDLSGIENAYQKALDL